MAEKVKVWDNEKREYVESKQEYDTYTITAIKKADQWTNGYGDEGVVLNLYADIDTGIITTNVKAYEARGREPDHG